ncbi:MAG: hypothetical protein JNL08_17055 [Planctomycetes bacterium]|nr:hypothetical protein [Planctomycetota bacterium]
MTSRLATAALLSLLSSATALAQCATTWLPGSTQTNGIVHAVAVLPNGDVVAGGTFTQIEGVAANHIARWDGTTWQPLGTGTSTFVYSICVTSDGDLVVGESSLTAFANPGIANVARWDGSSWTSLGAPWPAAGGASGAPLCLLEHADGRISAGGFTSFGFPLLAAATWNGTNWAPVTFQQPNVVGNILALAEDGNGDLLLGGSGPLGIYRWDGTTLQTFAAMGAGTAIYGLGRLPGGDLVAGGLFGSIGGVTANNIARYDGTTWHAFGSGTNPSSVVRAVCVLPNGDLVAGGQFTTAGGIAVNNIARWNGTAWSALGAGVTGVAPGFQPVRSLAFPPAGPLFVGGTFTTAGGAPCASLARLGTTCPATVAQAGVGCPGSGGANVLTAVTMPWVDSTLRTRGTGLASPAVVAVDTGLAPIVPGFSLASVFAEAPLGCDLHLVPLIVQAFVSTTGTVDAELFLPNVPPLVGVAFLQQWFPFEVGGNGFVEITATNALQLTAGQF